jgi:hypothetical protein
MKARTYIRLGETCTLELYYQIPPDLFQWDDCTSVTCTLRRTPVVYDCSVVMHGRTPTGSLHTRTVSMYARTLGPHCEPPSDSPRFLPDSIWSTCLVSVKVFHTFERRAAAITILVVIRVSLTRVNLSRFSPGFCHTFERREVAITILVFIRVSLTNDSERPVHLNCDTRFPEIPPRFQMVNLSRSSQGLSHFRKTRSGNRC